MKAFAAVLLASATLTNVTALHAETLKGSQVSGVLWVDGDTAENDFSPFGTSGNNAVTETIGPGVEFAGESFSFNAGVCDYSVNFSAAKVKITDICDQITAFAVPAATAAATKGQLEHDNFEMSFTDPAFAGDMITPIKNGLDLSFVPTIVGDTINFDLTEGASATNKSTFSITTAVTPEPASWQLLTLGLGGMLAMAYLGRQQSAKGGAGLPTA